MFLTCAENHQAIYISPFNSNLPHTTEFFFQNDSLDKYEPESNDPFIKGYFEDLKPKTLIALNFAENVTHEEILQFFENATHSSVEFVGFCYSGTDHEKSIDYLRLLDLNITYDKNTFRSKIWFVAFTEQESFDKLFENEQSTPKENMYQKNHKMQRKNKSNKKDKKMSQDENKFALKQIDSTIPLNSITMDEWIEKKNHSHFTSKDEIKNLKKKITLALAEYDKEENKYLETVELIRNKPNKDGWIKVLPKLNYTEVKKPIRVYEIESGKKRKREEIKKEYESKVPMYSFQVRQEKERNLQLLKQQFENARKKIDLLKRFNVFENSLSENVTM